MKIAVVAFPGFQMLDLAGPIDVFHEGARQAGQPDAYQFEIIAPVPGLLTASNGMRVEPDATLDTCSDDIDTLLVAGGPGLRQQQQDETVSAWLARQARTVRRMGSVCSGAMVLAHAGLLDGRSVTTHWNTTDRLARLFPGVQVEPDRIYVKDGNLYTSAGVTAGLDLALALVEEDFGRAVALRVARELVMFLKRPGGQSQFSAHLAAQTAERNAIREVQGWVVENLAGNLSVEALAAHAGMSARNFARIFKQECQVTPADFVEAARIDAARRLLEGSRHPLKRVAALAGFSDPNNLRRAFLRRVGVAPSDYRRRFRGEA
ncbi:Transcriptional regulator, AraC family [Cupriavidus necator H850]|jgi:transcriptional regulator GlxA family with amidase domain|uniref:GlxA family transcriptional regulator n=1 Tax=Cupriavidus TaxID=106589 RepID=UPI00129E5D26|nr:MULTISPECIES: GlxA family transcriptional regulator [Cupriavidus]KAI3609168.1 Transcriptional regulator, AraC family [Cupriavidus necator H850]QUN29139.1 GlxA family transcriptional regulator [Cupriavidus sp. KK10]